MMYFIVEFFNGSVEVVPDSWLLEDGNWSYWPHSRGDKLLKDIAQKRVPERSWRKCKVKKVMRKCGKTSLHMPVECVLLCCLVLNLF